MAILAFHCSQSQNNENNGDEEKWNEYKLVAKIDASGDKFFSCYF